MKRSIKEKWIARLRDPSARQAEGVLRRAGSAMCCLGHLYDVADGNWISGPVPGTMTTQDGEEYSLKHEKAFGLSAQHISIATTLNDGYKINFSGGEYDKFFVLMSGTCRKHSLPEIADWVEANVPCEED